MGMVVTVSGSSCEKELLAFSDLAKKLGATVSAIGQMEKGMSGFTITDLDDEGLRQLRQLHKKIFESGVIVHVHVDRSQAQK